MSTNKYLTIVTIILMFLIVGCTTEPTSSDLTSVTEPEVITETITETVEVRKYQC